MNFMTIVIIGIIVKKIKWHTIHLLILDYTYCIIFHNEEVALQWNIAQLVEHTTVNRRVMSSSLVIPVSSYAT